MLHDEDFQHDEGRLANQEKVLEVLNSLKLAEQRAIKMLAQSLGWPRTLCSALHFFCRCLFFLDSHGSLRSGWVESTDTCWFMTPYITIVDHSRRAHDHMIVRTLRQS